MVHTVGIKSLANVTFEQSALAFTQRFTGDTRLLCLPFLHLYIIVHSCIRYGSWGKLLHSPWISRSFT